MSDLSLVEFPKPEDDEPRRKTEDRRRQATPMISRYTFRGRRRAVRRLEETRGGYYVDRYHTVEVTAVLALLLLTVTDALATLHILGKGGTELNPLMRSALEVGNGYFLLSKLGISLVGATLILMHARFPGVRKALAGLLLLYGGVVVYHTYLISRTIM